MMIERIKTVMNDLNLILTENEISEFADELTLKLLALNSSNQLSDLESSSSNQSSDLDSHLTSIHTQKSTNEIIENKQNGDDQIYVLKSKQSKESTHAFLREMRALNLYGFNKKAKKSDPVSRYQHYSSIWSKSNFIKNL